MRRNTRFLVSTEPRGRGRVEIVRTSEMKALTRGPADGEALGIFGGLYTFKARAEDNGGAYTLIEVQARAGFAAPLHWHEHEEEGFWVASGVVNLLIGEQVVRATAGSFSFVPRGTQHSFQFDSPDAKLLLLLTPGGAGHEGFFREIGDPLQSHTIPSPPSAMPDPWRMAEIAARHGTRVVGPPPWAHTNENPGGGSS